MYQCKNSQVLKKTNIFEEDFQSLKKSIVQFKKTLSDSHWVLLNDFILNLTNNDFDFMRNLDHFKKETTMVPQMKLQTVERQLEMKNNPI